jgi:hypothetical protein
MAPQKLNGNFLVFGNFLKKGKTQRDVRKQTRLWKLMTDDEKRFWVSEKKSETDKIGENKFSDREGFDMIERISKLKLRVMAVNFNF